MSADQKYKDGEIVWIKLRNNYWWPGEVSENLRQQFKHVKKKPYCVVKFFNEDTFEYVHSANRVLPFRCSKKQEIIQLGLALHKAKYDFMEKFPADVQFAERLTQTTFVVNRPGSIIKAVLTQPLVHSCEESEEHAHNEPEIDEEKPSTSSMASRRLALRQITSKRRTQSISTIKILDIAPIRRSIGGESTVNQNSVTNSTAAPPASVVADPIAPSNKNDANLYRCGMCDFTSIRQNVIVLHRKTHGRLDRSASVLPTPAASHESSEDDANNSTGNLTASETMNELNGPSEDFSSAYIKATPPAKPTSTRRGRGPKNRNVEKLRTSTRTLRSSTAGQPFVGVASRTPNRTVPSNASRKLTAKVKTTRAADWLDDDRNIFVSSAADDSAVSDLDDADKATSDSLEQTEESKQESLEQQEKNAAALRQMLAADWSDNDEEKESESQNKISENVDEPANSCSQDVPATTTHQASSSPPTTTTTTTTDICGSMQSGIDVTITTAAITPPSSAKASVSYCRNIPKKDRYRDAVIKEFNTTSTSCSAANNTNIVTGVIDTEHTTNSSNNLSSSVPAAKSPAFIIIPDSSAGSDASFDSVVLIGTTKPPSDANTATGTRETSAAGAGASTSCFDFDEDEEENESDLLTSIANFKKKYYSLEKNSSVTTASQQPTEANGNNGHIESSATVNNGLETQRDDQLNDEIEKLLQQTKTTVAQVTADNIDLPSKERNKRIFRSRNIEDAELTTTIKSTTMTISKGTTSEMRKKLKEAHSALAEYSKKKQKAPTTTAPTAATKDNDEYSKVTQTVEPEVEGIAEPIPIVHLASDESSSEAGAEFGSPASMLDEERKPNQAAMEYLNQLQQQQHQQQAGTADTTPSNESNEVTMLTTAIEAAPTMELVPNKPEITNDSPPKKEKLNKKLRKLKLKNKRRKIKLKRAKREALKKDIAAAMQSSSEHGPIDMHKYAMSPSKALLGSADKIAKRKMKLKRKHSKRLRKTREGNAVSSQQAEQQRIKAAGKDLPHGNNLEKSAKSSIDNVVSHSNVAEHQQILPIEGSANQLLGKEKSVYSNNTAAALRKRRSHIKITPRRHHQSQDQQEHAQKSEDQSADPTQLLASEINCEADVKDPKEKIKLHEQQQHKKMQLECKLHLDLVRTQTNQQGTQPNESSEHKSDTEIMLNRAPSKLVADQVPLICSEEDLNNEKEKRKTEHNLLQTDENRKHNKTTTSRVCEEEEPVIEQKQKPRTTADIAEKLQHIVDVYRNAANKRATTTHREQSDAVAATLNVEHNYQQRTPSEEIQKAVSKEYPNANNAIKVASSCFSDADKTKEANSKLVIHREQETPTENTKLLRQSSTNTSPNKTQEKAEGVTENEKYPQEKPSQVKPMKDRDVESKEADISRVVCEKASGEQLEIEKTTATLETLEERKQGESENKVQSNDREETGEKPETANHLENILVKQQENPLEEVSTITHEKKHESGTETASEGKPPSKAEEPNKKLFQTLADEAAEAEEKEVQSNDVDDDIGTSDVIKEPQPEICTEEHAVELSEYSVDKHLRQSSTTPLELDNLEELPDTTSSTPSPPPFSPTITSEYEGTNRRLSQIKDIFSVDSSKPISKSRSESTDSVSEEEDGGAMPTHKERLGEFCAEASKYQKHLPNEKPIILQQEIIQKPLLHDQQLPSKPQTKRPHERLSTDDDDEPCKQQKKIDPNEVLQKQKILYQEQHKKTDRQNQSAIVQKHMGVDSCGNKYMMIKNSSPEQTCTVTSSTEAEQQKQSPLSIPPQTSPCTNAPTIFNRNAMQNNHHHSKRSLSSSSNCSSSSSSTKSSLSLASSQRREQRLQKHSRRQQSSTQSSHVSGANYSASPTSIDAFDSVTSPLPAKISKTATDHTEDSGSGSLDNAVWHASSEINIASRHSRQQRQSSETPATMHHLHNRTPRKQPQQHRSSTSTSSIPKKHLPLMAAQNSTTTQIPTNNINEQLMVAQSEETEEAPKILAVPTQPIPGYNDTFLLCTKGKHKYKPMNNTPLYLDHESNQLMPVPEEALKDVVIKLLSDRVPNATDPQEEEEEQEDQEAELQQDESGTSETHQVDLKNSIMPGAQLICLQPMDDGVEQQPNTDAVESNLLDPSLIEEDPIIADADESEGIGIIIADAAIDTHAYLPQDDAPQQMVPVNSIIMNLDGQQVILDAATFEHLLASSENSTQLITEDGTEFTLTRNMLLSLHAQHLAEHQQRQALLAQQLAEAAQAQEQQQQEQEETGVEAGSSADLIGMTMDGTELYASGGVLLEGTDGSTIMIPVADSELPEHVPLVIPGAKTNETNAVLDKTPIMSTLETPSTNSDAIVGIASTHGEGIIAVNPLTTASLYEAVTNAGTTPHCRPTLEDSLAVIGVTTQASSLELPITVTNPFIAPPPPMRLQPSDEFLTSSILEDRLAGVMETGGGNMHTNAAGS